ncbi:MAG: ABC transporter permease [Anaerolineae bacterium]|nr:ABC transporter permease [Anaerolineae bacterium]
MSRYIIRRLIQSFFTILVITTVIFVVGRAAADPMAAYTNNPRITAEDKARIAHNLGLDRPLPVQYLTWLGDVARGDLGTSFVTHQKVSDMIMERLPATLALMISALIATVIVSLIAGVFAATHQYSAGDNLITAATFIGFSMPVFFIGLSLIFIFGVGFKAWGLPYLPTGTDIWDQNDPIEWARHLVLPVLTLTLIQAAGYTRYLRSSLLDVQHQDYIRTAKSKGLADRAVLWKHALKNASLPFVTVLGLDIALLFGGALVTETIFSWPGLGRLFWEQSNAGDFPVMMAILLIVVTLVVVGQIVVDVVYTFLDPRIKLA